ncbi:MAG: hypothetical protein RhofKO_03110 [Rhodothermales bacterium]
MNAIGVTTHQQHGYALRVLLYSIGLLLASLVFAPGNAQAQNLIKEYKVANSDPGSPYALWISGTRYSVDGNVWFKMYDDGSTNIVGRFKKNGGSTQYDADVWLKDRQNSPRFGPKVPGYAHDASDWLYSLIDDTRSTLQEVGTNNIFTVEHRGEDAQQGVGASLRGQDIFGFSTWMTLKKGNQSLHADFNMFLLGGIGDFVWDDLDSDGIQDPGEPGIEGVKVDLYKCVNGGREPNPIRTTYTDPAGKYHFNHVPAGDYCVTWTLPNGYMFSPYDQGNDDSKDSDARPLGGNFPTEGETLCFYFDGDFDYTFDAGMFKKAKLGDLLFEDKNANGIQDNGEPGIDGVRVRLFKCDANGNIVGGAVATQNTANGGKYLFTDLTPGRYIVHFDQPSGFVFTTKDAGNNDAKDSDSDNTGKTDCITLQSGDDNRTVDAGVFKKAKLGDKLFNDLNGNGIQDNGEPGIDGVRVRLFACDSNGNITGGALATQNTANGGKYLFSGLTPGSYAVHFDLPNGFQFTTKDAGNDDAKDSDVDNTGKTDCVTLESGDDNRTVDAGVVKQGSIGDKLFNDQNGNGIQDNNEPGIDGVTVKLFRCVNGAVSGNAIANTQTANGGMYNFAGLDAGEYAVMFDEPAGFDFTTKDAGNDDAKDSDVNGSGMTDCFTLGLGEDKDDVDAGAVVEKASVGDKLFDDKNRNGIQDANEPGIDGVRVRLFACDGNGDITGPALATQNTSNGGMYTFANLNPGKYAVHFDLPAGFQFTTQDAGNDDAKDSDVDNTGKTDCFDLAAGENNDKVDAGVFEKAKLGDKLFNDLNQNGIQDNGEPGINGVTVKLYACDNNGSITGGVLDTQQTANGGKYLFTGLDAGTYAVVFDLPNGFVFTTQNAGNNEGKDSDVDANGVSDCFDLAAGQAERRVDAGVYEPAPQKIDLELTKTVNDPAPELNDVITFTLTLVNKGPVTATNIFVEDVLPNGLSYTGDNGGSKGSTVVTGPVIQWKGFDLATNETATLEIMVSVDQKGTFKNVAQVTNANEDDVDSTPNNDDGDQSEDDEDSASVTTGGSTGGGGGGVESDGDMASVLAQRMFSRRADAMTKQALRAAPSPIVMTADSRAATLFAAKGGSSFDIASLLPETGPQNSQAMVVTPDDLLGATNATSVFSADYVRTDGRRLGAILGMTSDGGSLYDHTKNTCDRLGGGRLDAVKLMDIDGRQFTLSTLIHADGQIDHAISFVAYRSGSSYAVDSRFAPDSYDIPAGVDEVINMQVWSVSTEYTADLVRDVIARLESEGTVSFINEGDTAPNVPSLYIHSGRYTNGQLTLRMVNTTGQPQTVTLSGSTTLTETEAQLASRTALERTVVIPAPAAGEHTVDVVVETGAIFDAAFAIEYEGNVMDRVYWADGPWGINGGNANVSTFETYASDNAAGESAGGGALMERYNVERDAYMGGTVTDYAVLFRYLRPAAMPVDLSTMTHLEFTAYGRGTVGLYVEKASITDGDQYGTSFRLGTEPQTYRIALDELRQQLGTDGFTAEDVTAVMFYVTGNGQAASAFDLVVESMAFTGSSTSVAIEDEAETPSEFGLSQNYPNPFNPSTRIAFTVPQSQQVRLVVYDVLGRPVQTLVDGTVRAGSHEVTFEAGNLPSGTYLYRLDANGQSLTRTLTLMK